MDSCIALLFVCEITTIAELMAYIKFRVYYFFYLAVATQKSVQLLIALL